MKFHVFISATLLLMSCTTADRAQVSASQDSLIRGIMQRVPDRTFRGVDTIYNRQSLVWYAKEVEPSETDFSIIPNYPNPYEPSLDVHLRLASTDSVTITYFDSNKRFLATAFTGVISKGEYTYHVIENQWASGYYYISCSIGQRSWVLRAYNKFIVR